MSVAKPPSTDTWLNQTSPAATSTSPDASTGLKPMRVTSCDAIPADRMIAIDSGR